MTWIEGTSLVLPDASFDVVVMTSHFAQFFVADDEWAVVTAAQHAVVSFTRHYEFPEGGELISTATLRFRTEPEIRSSLLVAGFEIEAIYGGWSREPVGSDDGELLVLARATGDSSSPPAGQGRGRRRRKLSRVTALRPRRTSARAKKLERPE